MRSPFAAALATLWLLLAPTAASAVDAGPITVEDAWARASIGAARNGAAYMTVTTTGPAPDRLVAAASPVAEAVELHAHLMEAGVMRMRPVAAIEVHPGEPAVLQPGGLHVMLIGLKAPLAEGGHFPLRLTFERAGVVDVVVAVRGARAGAGQGGKHTHH